MDYVHTQSELKQMQGMPLPVKIAMTQNRIRGWVNEYGTDGVYVSFSGGKDSTVLLNIVRGLYPDIPGVFVDTGLEYPEIREFVKTFDNIVWLKPKMNFRQVIETYGYPFFSKETSNIIQGARGFYKKHPDGNYDGVLPQRVRNVMGMRKHNGTKSRFDKSLYRFMLDAPFEISDKCCNVMKKAPVKKYEKETGRVPILGQLAEESELRLQGWLKTGCNAFNASRPQSNPMAFWREQDILRYIKVYNIPIASVYGNIVPDNGSSDFDGQMDFADLGLIEDNRPLKTTGCNRTGCMFCGFGCHRESNPNRFEQMKQTHPKQYDYIMRPKEQGGLNYKAIIDWINEHGNMDIRY